MFGSIKNLEITGILSGDSTYKAQMKKRSTHLLIYKVSGESVYYLRGKKIALIPGSVLYIPEGEAYEFEKISVGESMYYLVNFHADLENDVVPMIICNDKNEKILKIFKDMERAWRMTGTSDEDYEILSQFYRLIATAIVYRKNGYITHRQKGRIEPAVSYIEEHLYDKDLKTAELARLCVMSEVMLRKLFNVRFGMSPKKYIIQGRMQTAKAILENGEYKTVAEVARKVGYDDPLHFSKCFKEYFGTAPTNINKM